MHKLILTNNLFFLFFSLKKSLMWNIISKNKMDLWPYL